MDRLTRALFVAMTFVAIACLRLTPVSAQQAAQDSYVLAGDLANPLAHSYPAGTRLNVQQLLADGGLAAVQGTAVVLRGQPLAMASSEICPPTTGQSTSLLPGDIVIFRALQGWQGRQNVVRVSASSIEILAYDATSRFSLSQMFPAGAAPSTVTVHRTGFGQSEQTSLSPAEVAQHGDVILTELAPAPAGRTPAATDVGPPSQPTTLPGSNFLTIPGMASQEPAEIRSVSAPSDVITGPDDSAAPFAVSPFDLPVDGVSDRSFRSDTSEAVTPATTAVAAPLVSRTDSNPPADDLTAISDTPTAEAGQGAEALWNGLFVLGIVLALGLIAVGWVKTQQEQEREQQAAQHLQQELRHTDISTHPAEDAETSVASGEFELAPFLPQPDSMHDAAADWRPAVPSADTPESADAESDGVAAGEDPSESFHSDDTVVEESCPVLSAGIDATLADTDTQALNAQPQNMINAGDANHASVSAASVPSVNAPLVSPTEWFGEDWRKPIVEEIVEEAIEAESIGAGPTAEAPAAATSPRPQPVVAEAAAVVTPETARSTPAAESVEDDVEDTEVEVLRQRQATPPPEVLASFPPPGIPGFSEPQPVSAERQVVEDLIENRLPVNLQQADLPLNVSLFGKPSGPRRLRIDSAHTEIAPPHMLSRSRKRKRTQPTAASQSVAAPPATDGSAGLDNALNYIDEQLDK